MSNTYVTRKLERLLTETPGVPVDNASRFVIISDLHLGDGGGNDDFRSNAEILQAMLRGYYMPGGHHLVLNGDIEELHKFSLDQVRERWSRLFDTFRNFYTENGFSKIYGNHDYSLRPEAYMEDQFPAREALHLEYHGHSMLIFHGHQASRWEPGIHGFARFVLRNLGKPLRIPNYSVALSNRRRYRVERRIYEFARSRRVMAVIGHTHRPLFESLSKIDSLKLKIEAFCRLFPEAGEERRRLLEERIGHYKEELRQLLRKRRPGSDGSLYDLDVLVPCLFNSGCGIGRSGITALEIVGGRIQLVHWFDGRRSSKYFAYNGNPPERLEDSDYYRVILKSEPLDYLFARIRLLA